MTTDLASVIRRLGFAVGLEKIRCYAVPLAPPFELLNGRST